MHIDNFRSCTPLETLAKVSPFLQQLGITRLARQTGLDNIGIPVWCAFTPNAKAIVIAQGKGLDDEAAKTSAVMEAIERAVATRPSCEILTTSQDSLNVHGHASDTLDILLSPRAKSVAHDEEISWTRSRHLPTGDAVWVPFDAIHLDRTRENPRYWISSDGLASGNTLDEAVLHGLLERIERDATTLWQVSPLAKRYSKRIDTASITEPSLVDALDRIRRADLEIALFDITSDLKIPCVVALLGPGKRAAGGTIRHVDITLGAGASTLPSIAAMRAITEAVQSRMTFIAGARDDLLPAIFSHTADAETVSAMSVQPATTLDELPTSETATTGQSLAYVLETLKAAGIDRLYAVGMTPEWLPAAVVKVLAPQLENPDGERHQRYGSRALSKAF